MCVRYLITIFTYVFAELFVFYIICELPGVIFPFRFPTHIEWLVEKKRIKFPNRIYQVDLAYYLQQYTKTKQ